MHRESSFRRFAACADSDYEHRNMEVSTFPYEWSNGSNGLVELHQGRVSAQYLGPMRFDTKCDNPFDINLLSSCCIIQLYVCFLSSLALSPSTYLFLYALLRPSRCKSPIQMTCFDRCDSLFGESIGLASSLSKTLFYWKEMV